MRDGRASAVPVYREAVLHQVRGWQRVELYQAEQVREGRSEAVLLLRGVQDVASDKQTLCRDAQAEERLEKTA